MRAGAMFSLACLLAVAACSGGKGSIPSPLYRTVPSDAVEVIHFNDCSAALAYLLDSTDRFRNIDLGPFSSSEFVLSYSYAVSLIPLMAVDMGAETDRKAVKPIIDRASGMGIKSRFFSAADSGIGRAVLLMSPSEVILSNAAGHIAAGTSILDAKGFAEAVALTRGASGSMILRSSSASRFVPRKLLEGLVPRRDLVSAVSGFSQWTVLVPDAGDGYDVRTVNTDSRHASSHLGSMPGGKSELDGVLPRNTDLCIDIPMKSYEDYVRAYELLLDARSSLDRQRNFRRSLSARNGEKVESWASGQGILEIACLKWEGREVNLILSSASASSPAEIAPGLVDPIPNVHADYPAALFGKAFSLKDESFCSRWGKWVVSGSETDVKAFLDCMERIPVLKWSEKGVIFAVYTPAWMLYSSGQKVKLDMYD